MWFKHSFHCFVALFLFFLMSNLWTKLHKQRGVTFPLYQLFPKFKYSPWKAFFSLKTFRNILMQHDEIQKHDKWIYPLRKMGKLKHAVYREQVVEKSGSKANKLDVTQERNMKMGDNRWWWWGRCRLFWGQDALSPAIRCSHFKLGGKNKMTGIKKLLRSDLKITVIQLQH